MRDMLDIPLAERRLLAAIKDARVRRERAEAACRCIQNAWKYFVWKKKLKRKVKRKVCNGSMDCGKLTCRHSHKAQKNNIKLQVEVTMLTEKFHKSLRNWKRLRNIQRISYGEFALEDTHNMTRNLDKKITKMELQLGQILDDQLFQPLKTGQSKESSVYSSPNRFKGKESGRKIRENMPKNTAKILGKINLPDRKGTVEVINFGEPEEETTEDTSEESNLNLSKHWKLIRTAIEGKKYTRVNPIE